MDPGKERRMTLRLTEEQIEIRALAREFAAGEIRPHAGEWDARRELDAQVFAKLGRLGFLGMRIPEEFGGLGLDLRTYLLVLEEIAWGDPSVALALAIHSGPVTSMLLGKGTEAQKARFLPAMAAGECLGAFALSEAGAGSDARALETRAEPTASGWTVSGRKKWVTCGQRAGLIVLFARDAQTDGIHAFLVEPGRPGLAVGRRERTMGLAALDTVEVVLDGVELSADALLGEAGKGFDYARSALEVGRLGVATQAVGIGRAALEHARRYALERVQFGGPLAELQAIRFKLAGMANRLTSARALVLLAAESVAAVRGGDPNDGGEEGVLDPEAPSAGALAAMAKTTASEAAVWIADEAVQIYGGYGYMRDYPVEKLLRDAKGTEIYEGTNEIMRLIIARDLLGSARA
jgi:alkylation response protein AidB-like acyl-CoA dehydrogenase